MFSSWQNCYFYLTNFKKSETESLKWLAETGSNWTFYRLTLLHRNDKQLRFFFFFPPHHPSLKLSGSYITKLCDLYVFFKFCVHAFSTKVLFWLYTPETSVCLALKISLLQTSSERKVIDTWLFTRKNESDNTRKNSYPKVEVNSPPPEVPNTTTFLEKSKWV